MIEQLCKTPKNVGLLFVTSQCTVPAQSYTQCYYTVFPSRMLKRREQMNTIVYNSYAYTRHNRYSDSVLGHILF